MSKAILSSIILATLIPAAWGQTTPLQGSKLNIGPSYGGNVVGGSSSAAVGQANNVSGGESLAVGMDNAIDGEYSLATGVENYVEGNTSAAVGNLNLIQENSSLIVGEESGFTSGTGYANIYVGVANYGGNNLTSAIFGGYIGATNNSSSLISGFGHTADLVDAGLVAGATNVVTGRHFVLGTGLIATDATQPSVVVGQYNNSTPPTGKKFLFVVGNGTSSATANRKNAWEVFSDGTIRMNPQGDISMGEFAP